MNDETLDLLLKVGKILLVLFILFGLWIWLFDDGLTKEERDMFRYTYAQLKVIDDNEVSDVEAEKIDGLLKCDFFGEWLYTKVNKSKFLVTFTSEQNYEYESHNGVSHHKGSGKWRWLKNEIIWLQGNTADNNPLFYPTFEGHKLQQFYLLEADGSFTIFVRQSGNGC